MNEVKKYGISNILPLIFLGVEMGNVADKMGRTKGMKRYFYATELLDEAIEIRKVDFSQVRLEIADLDSSEREKIEIAIKEKFNIVDDNLENAIEKAISIVERQVFVITDSIDLYKELKAKK